jgi:hypothetical protein
MSDSLNRVVRTFLIAFFAVAIPGSLDWLHDLTAWANDGGQAAFPNAHSLAFLGLSAVLAGVIAALNFVVVLLENWLGHGFLRAVPPDEPPHV